MPADLAFSIEVRGKTKRQIRRSLPVSWSDIPHARRLGLFEELAKPRPTEANQIIALRRVLNLPAALWKAIDAVQAKALIEEAAAWLDLAPSDTPILEYYNSFGSRYYFPKAKGENLSCLEYALAEEYMQAFVERKDMTALRRLFCTLCREAHPDKAERARRGDVRKPLHSRGEVEAAAATLRMRRVPMSVQLMALLYFSGVKILVNRLYGATLFGMGEDAGEDSERRTDPMGWWGVFLDAAGEPTKLDAVLQLNFHTFCVDLMRKRRAQDAERQQLEMQRAMQNHHRNT